MVCNTVRFSFSYLTGEAFRNNIKDSDAVDVVISTSLVPNAVKDLARRNLIPSIIFLVT
jgi:hypothetical protein